MNIPQPIPLCYNLKVKAEFNSNMTEITEIQEGQILRGSLFNEPMRVETVSRNGSGSVSAGLVGLRSSQFRKLSLDPAQIASLEITDPKFSYKGDGSLLRLGLKARSLGIAYEFDPYFGLSLSKVDPLPHQLEAVYDYLLKLPSVRFLLADDAGAGKTIMAGLLIRELKLRGLVERVLVVCPANLAFQWQRELSDKFGEKFFITKGRDIRDQFGINQWMERNQAIVSLDLAKRAEMLPGLKQVQWDLVIIDEAHRMSARDAEHKSQRYKLGEMLRDNSDHILLLTATPHKGDPLNFTLFLQLLDKDVYADVKSIEEAMERKRAPFYLRRTKEAMVYFPEQQDGEWVQKPVFTKRITRTAGFKIDGAEFQLYGDISQFVKRQSKRAREQGEDRKARAVGFLMSLFQRRLASSTRAIGNSLENRANRLEDNLSKAKLLAQEAPLYLPDEDELEEYSDEDREELERMLEAVTLSGNEEEIKTEVLELRDLAAQAQAVEESGEEAKLAELRTILQQQGFFDNPSQRLLIFTEFKDTLNYLLERLESWGFRVGCIHGSMKPGTREEPNTRLHAEQQFKDGDIQILVATEAAGEGINLQCCHILFNYDIPWNPNRLEQRMGRIHRYGQLHDCLIFNFVADNTIEGEMLDRLLSKLKEIRDALNDDAVFNVVGEVLPASRVDSVFRDFYAGEFGQADLEERLLKDVDVERFREICQNALEGLASKNLNMNMLVERRARAQERRVVPETVARFMHEAALNAKMPLDPVERLPHTFKPGRTPPMLKRYEKQPDWKLPEVSNRYPRFSTNRKTAEEQNLEWVTPGHPLFEALRRHSVMSSEAAFAEGARFYSLNNESPARLDFYTAKVVDGLGRTIHERIFTVEVRDGEKPQLRELDILGDLIPADAPEDEMPPVASNPEANSWLHDNALQPFLAEVGAERTEEVKRISEHVNFSLIEVLVRIDQEIGRLNEEVEKGVAGAEGRLAQANSRHEEVTARREQRKHDLEQQQALTLQGVERITSVLVLPHPERNTPEVSNMRPNMETEAVSMRVVMEHEQAQGRAVEDVSLKNLGYDITSIDLKSGDLRLIEVKGFAAPEGGTIILTPNEHRVAQDRSDCYWLYVVTDCTGEPVLQEPIFDPARLDWGEVSKVAHFTINTKTLQK